MILSKNWKIKLKIWTENCLFFYFILYDMVSRQRFCSPYLEAFFSNCMILKRKDKRTHIQIETYRYVSIIWKILGCAENFLLQNTWYVVKISLPLLNISSNHWNTAIRLLSLLSYRKISSLSNSFCGLETENTQMANIWWVGCMVYVVKLQILLRPVSRYIIPHEENIFLQLPSLFFFKKKQSSILY